MDTKAKLLKLCKVHVRKLIENILYSHYHTHLSLKNLDVFLFNSVYFIACTSFSFLIVPGSRGNHWMWLMWGGWKSGSGHLKPLRLGQHAHGAWRHHWRRLQKKTKKKKQALQCWLVQDGSDVHKLLTWIEGWCSMKTKRHLLVYQLHGKQWHFPFGSAWPSSKREEDHSSRSEVTLRSECLLRVVCVVRWFVFFNVDFISVFERG